MGVGQNAGSCFQRLVAAEAPVAKVRQGASLLVGLLEEPDQPRLAISSCPPSTSYTQPPPWPQPRHLTPLLSNFARFCDLPCPQIQVIAERSTLQRTKSMKRVSSAHISCLRVTFLTSRTKSCPLDPCCSNPVGRVCTWSYFRLTLSWLVLVLVHLDSTEI